MTGGIAPNHGIGCGKRSQEGIKDGVKYGVVFTIVVMMMGGIVTGVFATGFDAGLFRAGSREKGE